MIELKKPETYQAYPNEEHTNSRNSSRSGSVMLNPDRPKGTQPTIETF